MTLRLAVMWIVLAAVLGFALGGAVVDWSLERPPYQKHHAARDNQQADSAANNDRSAFFAIGAWAGDNAAAIGALSAIGVLLFTVVLAVSTILLWEATRGLQKSGERQFLATHRPRMRVREFHLINLGPSSVREIRFTASNIGASRMVLRGAVGKVELFRRGQLPPVTYLGADDISLMDAFVPGALQEQIAIPCRLLRESFDLLGSSNAVHVYGYIAYADELDRTFLTAFCRVYDPGSGRFSVVDDPDYEHED